MTRRNCRWIQLVYGLDLIAAVDGSDDATYFLYDGLGSTTEVLDEAGDVTDAYTYDVFGAVRASAGSSANDWLFTAEQHDPARPAASDTISPP